MLIRFIIAIIYIILILVFSFLKLEDYEKECCDKDKKPYIPSIFIFMIIIHTMALFAIFAISNINWKTILFIGILLLCFGLSVTAGQHRLYTHETYNVNNEGLEWFYSISNLFGISTPTIDWVKTHKQHHKYSDTCKDPHYDNSFSYSHIGWILREEDILPEILKDPAVIKVLNNPILKFQKEWYLTLTIIIQIILFSIPMLWGDFWNGFWLHFIRIVYGLNAEFSVNSLAHYFGYKPYDEKIKPSENMIVSTIAVGEGYHNYHHTYPKDFRACSSFYDFNITTIFLLICYKLGIISNLKFHSKKDLINKHDKEIINNKEYYIIK